MCMYLCCVYYHMSTMRLDYEKKKYIAKRNSKFPGARKCATSFNQPGSQKPMPMVCKTKTQGLASPAAATLTPALGS